MTVTWIVIGLGVVGALIALATSWKRRDRLADLGAVSHQWMAEHRQAHDPRR
jgi:hypothetical protein